MSDIVENTNPAADPGFAAEVDSAFDFDSPSEAEPQEEAAPPAEEPAEEPAEVLSEETGEQPAAAAEEETAELPTAAAGAAEPELDEDDIQPDIKEFRGKKEYHFPEAKGQRLLAAHQMVRELNSTLPPEAVTVDGIKAAYQHSQALQAIQNDVMAGNYEPVLQDIIQLNPNYFPGFAMTAVNALQQHAPQVFHAKLATPLVTSFLAHHQRQAHAALSQAKTQEEKDQATQVLYAARLLSHELSGEYLTDDQLKGIPVADPLAADRQALHAERQTLQRDRQQRAADELRAWDGQFINERQTAVLAAVNQVLDRAKPIFEGQPPTIRQQTLDAILQKTRDELAKDPILANHYNLKLQGARQGDANAKKAAIDAWAGKAARVATAYVKRLAEETSTAKLAQNKQTRDRFSTQHREPGGSAAPVKRSIATPPAVAKQAGVPKDQFERELEEAFRL